MTLIEVCAKKVVFFSKVIFHQRLRYCLFRQRSGSYDLLLLAGVRVELYGIGAGGWVLFRFEVVDAHSEEA